MTRNIDELVDQRTGDQTTPGDRLKETFLDERPESQWPPYLDDTAKQVADGVAIGTTELGQQDFPHEVGPLYKNGLLATTDNYSDIPETIDDLGETDLGRAIYLLNRLSLDLRNSESELDDVQRAITAVLEKILSDSVDISGDISLSQRTDSTADILLQLLSDPVVAEHVDDVMDTFEETYDTGLLYKLDEPQMMTPLWDHQQEALKAWLQSGRRGYVDMATATGKTVLGLAAIAAEFGSLHDRDSDIDTDPQTSDAKADVLVVAHNDLILEQWRREFDRHLSVPPDRTQGSNDVDLTWGRIHFRTAQSLLNQELIAYDLVILDEAHHYANGSGWGDLLERFNTDIIALSGSVDTGSDEPTALQERLRVRVGPELLRYTISEAQSDGIIPTFDWQVTYTPAGVNAEFVEISENAKAKFDRFRERLEASEIDVPVDTALQTFDDITAFSHTSEGKNLKEENDDFQDLVTTLFSRRTQRWNQSPEIETVADIAAEYSNRKTVILTNNNAQVDALAERLQDRSDSVDHDIYTVRSNETSKIQRDTVDQFDLPGEPALLIGTGDLLGEGVDMRHAEVGINMATGSVNKQLIQRIGRILRNPTGNKEAEFLNLVGLPAERGAQIPEEDGQALIEDAAQFHQFGRTFGNEPYFATAGEIKSAVERLLTGGRDRISGLLDADMYTVNDDQMANTVTSYVTAVDDYLDEGGTQRVLTAWGPKTQEQSAPDTATDTSPEEVELRIKVVGTDGASVEDAFVSLVGDSTTRYGRTNRNGWVSFTIEGERCTAAIHDTGTGTSTIEIDATAESVEETVTIGAGGGS